MKQTLFNIKENKVAGTFCLDVINYRFLTTETNLKAFCLENKDSMKKKLKIVT